MELSTLNFQLLHLADRVGRMQITKAKQTKVSVELTVTADEAELLDIKRQVLNGLRPQVKASGFRPGKAPDKVVEKELGADVVQKEFLDEALAQLFSRAIQQENIKLLGQPTVNVQKYVPYTELAFVAEIELRPTVTLPELKTLKATVKPEPVTDERIDEVLENLRKRAAQKQSVKRAAKSGDEAVINFTGKDAKGKPVPGAEGKDMPLLLGSSTFIPGFEDQLIGLKKGDTKSFTLTFPKDYHAKGLQSAKVTFDITVKDVMELELPKLDDEFVVKASPFKTVKELREDVSKQLEEEYARQASKAQREEVVGQLLEKTKLDIPPKFLEQTMDEVREDFRRSIAERGQDEDGFYEREGTDKDTYEKTELRPVAERRTKGSLILGTVADQEEISREELDAYIDFLRQQYAKDAKALEQLDRPQVREDIAMQMLTERTIDRLVELASQ
jgi:trigger factor